MSQTQSPREPTNGPQSIPPKPLSRPSSAKTSSSSDNDNNNNNNNKNTTASVPSNSPSPTPPVLEKRPSFLQRAATAARKVITGKADKKKSKNNSNNKKDTTPTAERIARKVADALQHLGQERDQEGARQHARKTTLRSRALARPNALDTAELHALAVCEGVYLAPRRRGGLNDIRYDRRHEQALVHGLVARLATRRHPRGGPDGDNNNNNNNNDNDNDGKDDHDDAPYVFLGADRALYHGYHAQGLGARRIGPGEEAPEFRQLSRAYYQLCL